MIPLAGPTEEKPAVSGGYRISVLVPARDERESLPAMLEELPKDLIHEIIVVDGHSNDGTPQLVRKLGYRVITQQGRGYGMAVISGLRAAGGDLVTFMDADGSFDPKELPRLLELIEQGYDIVFCSRYLPGAGSDDDTFIRKLGNKIFTVLLRTMFGVRLSDALFFYALGKKAVFARLDLECKDFALCVEVPIKVHRAGYKYTEIASTERRRLAGVSKVNAALDGLRILAAMLKLRFGGR